MRKQNRRVFDRDGNFVCWIDESEAREKLSSGLAIPCYMTFGDGSTREVGIQLGRAPKDGESDTAAISLAEMQANVGITASRVDALKHIHIVNAARDKIGHYQSVRESDADGEKAPLARGSWPSNFDARCYGKA
jgi:hypothetical protein